jgi:ferredoxin
MTVLQGADALGAPSIREATVLARNGAGKDQRLSCQCRVLVGNVDLIVTTGYW